MIILLRYRENLKAHLVKNKLTKVSLLNKKNYFAPAFVSAGWELWRYRAYKSQ